MSLVGEEACGSATPSECVTLYSRFCFFLSGVLDSFSFSLFCLPFSAVIHMLSSVCFSFLGDE